MSKYKPTRLTEAFVEKVPHEEKGYTIRDTKVAGLLLVVNKRSKSYKIQRDLWTGQPYNVRRFIAGEQRRGFLIPSLVVARQKWEAHKGRPVNWPEEVHDWGAAAGHYPMEDTMPF